MSYFKPISHHPSYSSIRNVLIQIARNKLSPQDVLKQLNYLSGNIQKNQSHSYKRYAIYKQYKNEIPTIFQSIAQLILDMQQEKFQIPILYQGQRKQVILKRRIVVYLLSLMAMNLVCSQPYNNGSKLSFNYNNNFSFIFKQSSYKTKCIIEYFKNYFSKNKNFNPEDQLVIKRKVENKSFYDLLKQFESKEMISYQLRNDNQSIEQWTGSIKTDFSNKFIGGGALTKGCVQEEIMFSNHPQMYVSILLCESLNQNQAVLFVNFQKFFKNNGYSYQTQYDGFEKPSDKKQIIIAIDAIDYKKNPALQFEQRLLGRQILKAYAGFNQTQYNQSVVTGNWGCGAFGGDVITKFLIQWIACTMAGKKMIYCPFGQRNLILKELSFLADPNKKNIGQMYRILKQRKGIKKNSFGKINKNIGDPQKVKKLILLIALTVLAAFAYCLVQQIKEYWKK